MLPAHARKQMSLFRIFGINPPRSCLIKQNPSAFPRNLKISRTLGKQSAWGFRMPPQTHHFFGPLAIQNHSLDYCKLQKQREFLQLKAPILFIPACFFLFTSATVGFKRSVNSYAGRLNAP